MQRRDFSKQLAGTSLGLSLGLTVASVARAQGGPVEGTHYVKLSTPAAVTLSSPDKKIEVVEFFWYGCPHCFAFEPILDAWARSLPADVAFRRVPAGFSQQYQVHQRVFYALEELGLLESHHRLVFSAIHQQNVRLNTDAEITAFMVANNVDGAKLATAFKSFSVNTKATRARQLAEAYKIDGVPALGVHGRFYTAASLAGSHERAVKVADFLIQRARQSA